MSDEITIDFKDDDWRPPGHPEHPDQDIVNRLRNSDGFKVVRNFSPEPGYETAIVADTDLMLEAANVISDLYDLINFLDIEIMSPHMGGGHRCRVNGHADLLEPEHWALIDQAKKFRKPA